MIKKYESFILSYNGSVITNCKDDSILLEESLTKNDIHMLYDFSKIHNVDIITYLNDEIVSESKTNFIDIEVEITGLIDSS